MEKFKFKHILLKLSGEALMGKNDFGIDIPTIDSITKQIYVIFWGVVVQKKDVFP